MKVVPCTREHLRQIEIQKEQKCEETENFADILEPEVLAAMGRTILTDDGRPIAAIGVAPIMPRVGTAWGVISDEAVREHGPLLSAVAKRGLAKILDAHIFRRIDVMVRADFDRALDWAVWLGFDKEGEKENYGPNGDTTYAEMVIFDDFEEAA